MVAVTWILLVVNLFKGNTRTMRLLAVLPMVFLGFRYMGWRCFATLNLDDGWLNASLSILMLGMEIFIFLINTLSSWILFTMKTDRTPQADEMQKAVLSGKFLPTIDIYIPNVNEPPDILRRTITGCQQLNYPKERINIWLLDDGKRPVIRELAQTMGVGYFDRPTNEHFKAGNVNNALWQTHNELIMFLDADFVPAPHFLTRVVGFFQDPNIALVQTPQNFYNPDLVETNLGLENSFTNEQDLFFRNLQPGRDAFNAVICCGTGFVIRRDRLEALGGVPTETITEDLMTSVYLQAQGYQVAYLNEAIAFGEAPNRSVDHLKQRVRWARGILQTLFTDVNPITCQNLSFWQRFYHLVGVLYWVMSFPRMIVLLMPLSYMLFDLIVIKASLDTVFCYFVPYYLASMVLFSWFNNGRRSPFWSDVYELIPTFHLIPNIISTIFNPFGIGFKVTPKGVTTDKISINWDVVGPCMVIIALYIIGSVRVFADWSWGVNGNSAILNLVWSGYSIGLLWMTAMACMDVPQKRSSLRFNMAWQFQLFTQGLAPIGGETLNISEAAVLVRLKPDQWAAWQQQDHGVLSLPEMGIAHVPVTFKVKSQSRKWVDVLCYHGDLPQEHYGLWIRHVFARLADTWEDHKLNEFKYLWHFIRAPLRMYPFIRG
jgi:cellulose synthase (UDP-forming)